MVAEGVVGEVEVVGVDEVVALAEEILNTAVH